MIYNSILMRDTSQADRDHLGQVTKLLLQASLYMTKNPERHSPTICCHSICRALAEHLSEIVVVDGHCLGLYPERQDEETKQEVLRTKHSWLLTPDRSIIDPYPVGFISRNPILVVTQGTYTPFGAGMYKEDTSILDRIDLEATMRETKELSKIISEAKKAAMLQPSH